MQIMPFEAAKTYRFNPFDLTKVWPHSDYPLIEVGRLTLDRNVSDYHTEMEQAAFEPNNLVPGIALSPDKMLLARGFSYADAHRARLGVNYKQIPVNSPKVPVHAYSKDGAMRVRQRLRPGLRAELQGRPAGRQRALPADQLARRRGHHPLRVRAARADDDFVQAGTMVREVLDDAGRERLVSNIVGHLLNGVTEPVLQRAFEYWRNVDKDLGEQDRVRCPRQAGREGPEGRGAGQPGPAEHAGQGLNISPEHKQSPAPMRRALAVGGVSGTVGPVWRSSPAGRARTRHRRRTGCAAAPRAS